jgi:hypothetical protein
VQTRIRFGTPPIMSFADCMFGRKRRLVWRSEKLTLLPEAGALPQSSQRNATPVPFAYCQSEGV